VDLENLKELIRIFEESKLAEVEIEEEGRRVRLKKYEYETQGAPSAPAPARPAARPSTPDRDALTAIKSPMPGTFYAALAPEDPPLVRPGDTVNVNQVVCVVEAMKLKNEVTAKFPAVVEEVLVQNGEPVEFGQPLFVVRPIV
jgi:acetyl-CoA carboxylase biotin carboxyl carrier protein